LGHDSSKEGTELAKQGPKLEALRVHFCRNMLANSRRKKIQVKGADELILVNGKQWPVVV
jgi:hypothetical protein